MISCQILQGNCYDVVSRLLPTSIGKYRVIITSPPYYGQRHYGQASNEIGHEKDAETYIKRLAEIFLICRDLLSDDGSLWVVCGDTRRNYRKLMIPHRLALKLVEAGYTFRDDIIWYKKNNASSSSKVNLTQAYEVILFLSKHEKCFTAMNKIRTKGNEAIGGKNNTPPSHLVQYEPDRRDREKIVKILEIIHNAKSKTPIEELPTTSEISLAYGYDPEKYCPTCYRKFKRHATRKRIGAISTILFLQFVIPVERILVTCGKLLMLIGRIMEMNILRYFLKH